MDDLDRLKEKMQSFEAGRAPKTGGKAEAEAQNVNTGLRAGSELVISIVASAALGYGIDKWLGTKPWALLIFLLLGVGAGFMAVYRITNNAGDAVGFLSLQKRVKSSTKPPENLDNN